MISVAPAEHQPRVLLFGVAGALVFRALAIGAGITLVERVQWIAYPFATLILLAAWRLLFGAERERKVVKQACDVCGTWVARVVRVSPVVHGHDFWRRESGRLVATPLSCHWSSWTQCEAITDKTGAIVQEAFAVIS